MALPNIQPYETSVQDRQSFQDSMEDFAESPLGVATWISLLSFSAIGTGCLVRKSGHGWLAAIAATAGVAIPVFFVDYFLYFAGSVPVVAPVASAFVAYKAYKVS